MKIKRFFAIFMIMAIILPTSVFAIDQNMVFGGFKMYTGTVWLLNDEDNTVILQNVKTKNMYGQDVITRELEYKAISIIPQNIFHKNGTALSFETINSYLLDSKVTFIAAVNGYEHKVLYMEVQ